MHRMIIAMLLAGVSAPAFAAAAQSDFAAGPLGERSARVVEELSSDELERRQAPAERARSQASSGRQQPPAGFGSPRRPAAAGPVLSDPRRPEAVDSVRDWRSAERRRADSPALVQERNLRRGRPEIATGDFVEQVRPLPPVLDRNRPRIISQTPVFGAEPPPPASSRTAHARPDRDWRTDWRRDPRYDWHDYRRRHRSLFHLGIYYDPFGWDYYRYGIGFRLWPSHYSSRYWLHDPWSYRLPRAYGPYRWVRYWDDALLVNVYTGEVVDVIHDFFW